MSLKKLLLLLFVSSVSLGTLTFFISKLWGLDFKPYAFGLLMGFVLYVVLKTKKGK
jgi:hypothetical protein